jgi:hypothetical protein
MMASDAKSESSIQVHSLILCDDVRREESGKDILIGVYSGDILVPQFPAALSLSLWAEYTVRGTGPLLVAFRMTTDRGTELLRVEVTISIGNGGAGAGSIAFRGIGVPLTDPCNLLIAMRQQDSDWVQVRTKAVGAKPGQRFESTPSGKTP